MCSQVLVATTYSHVCLMPCALKADNLTRVGVLGADGLATSQPSAATSVRRPLHDKLTWLPTSECTLARGHFSASIVIWHLPTPRTLRRTIGDTQARRPSNVRTAPGSTGRKGHCHHTSWLSMPSRTGVAPELDPCTVAWQHGSATLSRCQRVWRHFRVKTLSVVPNDFGTWLIWSFLIGFKNYAWCLFLIKEWHALV